MIKMLMPDGEFSDLASFDAIPLPINPDVEVVGIIHGMLQFHETYRLTYSTENCSIVKNASSSLKLHFRIKDGGEYIVWHI